MSTVNLSVFKLNNKKHTEKNMFFDEMCDIARYDIVKYPQIVKQFKKARSFHWLPEKIELTKDKSDFKSMPDFKQELFLYTLRRQILLDSIQGRNMSLCFMPIVSLPELESAFVTLEYFEQIHSYTYSYIISNIFSDDKIFDAIKEDEYILACANDTSKYFDSLLEDIYRYKLEQNSTHSSLFEMKKKLWKALFAWSALEGIRFYSSFAISWSFAENGLMEGNAKLIREICYDENNHFALSTQIIKLLPSDDPDFAIISKELEKEVVNIYSEVIDQELEWTRYVFRNGSHLGLNEKLLSDYVLFIAGKRAKSVGIKLENYDIPKVNPLPWTEDWISGDQTQVAPQEVELTEYIIGGLKSDLDDMEVDI